MWEKKNPGTTIFLSPFPYLHYVEGHPMLVFRKNFGAFFNKLTFKLYSFGVAKNTMTVKKWLGIHERISRKQLTDIVDTRKFIYTISPGLFPRPDYWDSNVQVLGYHELKRKTKWFFPKMYAVIHHGGSGTTHLAIKYGCATMAIPHFIDQFVWDTLIHELGVGPMGIKVSRMTRKNLEPKILELLTNKSYKENSERIGKQLKEEDYKEELYQSIIK